MRYEPRAQGSGPPFTPAECRAGRLAAVLLWGLSATLLALTLVWLTADR